MNENEIRGRTDVAVLELLRAVKALTDAHVNILMRHFRKARKDLFDLRDAITEVIKLIPEEENDNEINPYLLSGEELERTEDAAKRQ